MKFWHSRHDPQIKLSQNEMYGISREIRQEFAPKAAINAPELVLLPVDPYHLYAYWNLGENKSSGLSNGPIGNDLTLRVYWRPDESNNIRSSKLWFEVVLQGTNNQQKVRLPIDATAYSAAIGKCYPGFGFVPYVTSNIIQVPRGRMVLQEPNTAISEAENIAQKKVSGKEKTHRETITKCYDEAFIDAKINDILSEISTDAWLIAEIKSSVKAYFHEIKENYYDEAQIDAEILSTLYEKGMEVSLISEMDFPEKSHYASENASGQGNT